MLLVVSSLGSDRLLREIWLHQLRSTTPGAVDLPSVVWTCQSSGDGVISNQVVVAIGSRRWAAWEKSYTGVFIC